MMNSHETATCLDPGVGRLAPAAAGAEETSWIFAPDALYPFTRNRPTGRTILPRRAGLRRLRRHLPGERLSPQHHQPLRRRQHGLPPHRANLGPGQPDVPLRPVAISLSPRRHALWLLGRRGKAPGPCSTSRCRTPTARGNCRNRFGPAGRISNSARPAAVSLAATNLAASSAAVSPVWLSPIMLSRAAIKPVAEHLRRPRHREIRRRAEGGGSPDSKRASRGSRGAAEENVGWVLRQNHSIKLGRVLREPKNTDFR